MHRSAKFARWVAIPLGWKIARLIVRPSTFWMESAHPILISTIQSAVLRTITFTCHNLTRSQESESINSSKISRVQPAHAADRWPRERLVSPVWRRMYYPPLSLRISTHKRREPYPHSLVRLYFGSYSYNVLQSVDRTSG